MVLNLLRKLFFGFNRLERTIFDALRKILDNTEKQIFNSQINEINRIVRDPEGMETLFFKIHFGKVSRQFSRKFSADNGVQLFAELQIAYFDRVLPVKVWLFDGVVYRVTYDSAQSTMLDVDNYTVIDSKLLYKSQ